MRVTSVPLTGDSLNEGDVFVLDTGNLLMQWNGKSSSKKERAKALQVSRARDHGLHVPRAR